MSTDYTTAANMQALKSAGKFISGRGDKMTFNWLYLLLDSDGACTATTWVNHGVIAAVSYVDGTTTTAPKASISGKTITVSGYASATVAVLVIGVAGN